MFTPTTSIFSSSFFSFSFSFSFFLAFAVMDSTAVETWVCQQRRQWVWLQHYVVHQSPPARGQREANARSVLSAGINKINFTPYVLLFLRDKQATMQANKWHRYMNVDWVQSYMSKDKLLMLGINHYCLGLYVRFLLMYFYQNNQWNSYYWEKSVAMVSVVNNHIYRNSYEPSKKQLHSSRQTALFLTDFKQHIRYTYIYT